MIEMKDQQQWTQEDWDEYYAFLAEEEIKEDLYFEELFYEIQADAMEAEF